ncbi:hypothetical protein JMJ35_009043 [Cladonia borealis]|uniref:Uncharacterized protein n=1 Tax=Cladonia borealis TaxID=184061 RepID=A0AA39UYP3_9LECA|nr:hypothetical protein JMJ35_009043 [Cladonia borealis]
MRKSSSTANSHNGHNGRQGRARRREACSGSVERNSHSDQVFEGAEAQPKITNSNRFAALPPRVPAPDTISQSNKIPQSDFSFRCDPHPSTASRTNKTDAENTVLAPPAVRFPCTNQQKDPDPITISPLPPSTSMTPTDVNHTSKPLPSPPTTPPPILLHGDLHESPVRQESPPPEPLNDKQQRPRPALHPSFQAEDASSDGLVFQKPHRQPTPFPSTQRNGKRGRSRSNSSKDKEGGMKNGGEEQKKEEDKKKGGVFGRIERGIARMSRKGSERAEMEEGWREGVSDGDRHHLEDEEEDGEGGWELIGPSG